MRDVTQTRLLCSIPCQWAMEDLAIKEGSLPGSWGYGCTKPSVELRDLGSGVPAHFVPGGL